MTDHIFVILATNFPANIISFGLTAWEIPIPNSKFMWRSHGSR